MLNHLDNFYEQQEEPIKACLLALRSIILKQSSEIICAWKYKMPFFCFRGKMFCYLWTDKKSGYPYLGIVDGNKISHPNLIAEKRARMKIFLVDPSKDIPINSINQLLQVSINLLKKDNNTKYN